MKRILAFLLIAASAWPVLASPQATASLNAYRESKSRAPLIYSDSLERIATVHAQDMAKHGFFSHTGRNGSGIGDRLRAQGYNYCFVAENIAKGQMSLSQVMQSWAGSAGHRKNMLHRKATEFAVARAPGNIWVMVLATPGC